MTVPKLLAVTTDTKLARQFADLVGASYQVVHLRAADAVEPALRADRSIAVLLVDHAPESPAATVVRLLEVAQERRPDVRRGLVTGYSDVGAIVRAIHCGAAQFVLQRPIIPGELLAALAARGVIAGADPRGGGYVAA
jgi:DNA-binding NtrC family response regulator